MEIHQGVHLTYCTNIHPGEAWQQVRANLEHYLPTLRDNLSLGKAFGIGLRLADVAAQELLQGDALPQFQSWLAQENLYVFTLNGFPFGGFHHQIVKDQVYAPDWRERTRLAYTIRLAQILAALLPTGIDGSISTLPLSYKPWWRGNKAAWEAVLIESTYQLAFVTAEMMRIREATGKLLHIDLEPEPDGMLENAAEVISFFQDWLLPLGSAYLADRQRISPAQAETMLREHVRVCYDTCHFAIEYEDPASVFWRFQAAGIKIGKIQLSAAIKAKLPASVPERSHLLERLRSFAESTYLHQVIERHPDARLHRYPDLAAALPHLDSSQAEEWRIHFHVPIFIDNYQGLQSTQDHLVTVLQLLLNQPICRHLEIETYTWDVLPQPMKLKLPASIEREYEWVLAAIAGRNASLPLPYCP